MNAGTDRKNVFQIGGFEFSVNAAALCRRSISASIGAKKLADAVDFTVSGCSFEEPTFRNGGLLINGFHWDMQCASFVSTSFDISSYREINPHHFLVCCNVNDLYEMFASREKSSLINALPILPKEKYQFFTKQPIQNGRVLCSYQVRYRL